MYPEVVASGFTWPLIVRSFEQYGYFRYVGCNNSATLCNYHSKLTRGSRIASIVPPRRFIPWTTSALHLASPIAGQDIIKPPFITVGFALDRVRAARIPEIEINLSLTCGRDLSNTTVMPRQLDFYDTALIVLVYVLGGRKGMKGAGWRRWDIAFRAFIGLCGPRFGADLRFIDCWMTLLIETCV